ncbi:hypothetical protein ACFQ3W_06710 [Paenibacillus puldeungensis]|uniref:Yip1 domain-containing protein n=1 Tax=Paenibacillus puldeungensis TaxID=696536 RepID=A0ABW3RU47_9BACL
MNELRGGVKSIFNKIPQIITLVVLTIFCFIYGREVISRFNGELFSHSAVPIEYSLIFLLLLISIGIILGFLIEGTSAISKIIFWWPVVHFVIDFLCFIVGLAWETLLALVLYTIIVMPINLIGEGISLGFQINRLFFYRDKYEIISILLGLFINLSIIIYVLFEISKDYLANLFM